MSLLAISLAAVLGTTLTPAGERPVWAGALQPGQPPIVVSTVAGGLAIRSATQVLTPGGDSSVVLGPGLCPGDAPCLGVPSGASLFLVGPGSPATLVAIVSLPSQAVSAAVPVLTSSGCRLAVALQSGDVALVGASGGLQTLSAVTPAIADWHEFPRGVLIASREDLLVVGGVDGSLAAVQVASGARFAGAVPTAAVPGAVWTDGEPSLWFLGKTGSLHAWRVTTELPQVVVPSTVAAPGGLVAWGGKTDHGIAWADMQGQVWAWKGGAVRQVVRLSAGVRWPMLVADLEDSGDLKLVAAVDGQAVALVNEEPAGASFNLLPLFGRPLGPVVAYQLSAEEPFVLSVPSGPAQASLLAGDPSPAGQLSIEKAVLVPGSQVSGQVPGAMTASLVVPPGTAYGSGGATGSTGTTGSTGSAGTASQSSTGKSGFSCATVSGADALGFILLAPLLLSRRRRDRRG
jgi:hypothetical protein